MMKKLELVVYHLGSYRSQEVSLQDTLQNALEAQLIATLVRTIRNHKLRMAS